MEFQSFTINGQAAAKKKLGRRNVFMALLFHRDTLETLSPKQRKCGTQSGTISKFYRVRVFLQKKVAGKLSIVVTLLTYRISKEIFHLISFCRVFLTSLAFALHFFIRKAIFLSLLSVRKASELYTWGNTPAISLTLCTTNKRNLVLFQLIKRNMLEPQGNIK